MSALAPVPTPWRQRLADLRRGPLTVVVWLAAAAGALTLLQERARVGTTVGLAEALRHELSVPIDGVLADMHVELYESVERGQVLADLDDAGLAARMETARADVARLQAELAAGAARLPAAESVQRASWETDLLRFQVDEADRRLAALELTVALETDRVLARRLERGLARERPLADDALVTPARLDTLELELAEVSERIDRNERLLLERERVAEGAAARTREFVARAPEAAPATTELQPLRAAIDVAARRLDELQVERRLLLVRAPLAGQVTAILAQRGQAVVPGQPLLQVTARACGSVLAWVPGPLAADVAPDDVVLVSRLDRAGPAAESVVTDVGPAVESLPRRLWRDPNVPDFGRPVRIGAVAALALIPGERVAVRLSDD